MRDEMANLAWAIEQQRRRGRSNSAGDRLLTGAPSAGKSSRCRPSDAEAPPRYLLSSSCAGQLDSLAAGPAATTAGGVLVRDSSAERCCSPTARTACITRGARRSTSLAICCSTTKKFRAKACTSRAGVAWRAGSTARRGCGPAFRNEWEAAKDRQDCSLTRYRTEPPAEVGHRLMESGRCVDQHLLRRSALPKYHVLVSRVGQPEVVAIEPWMRISGWRMRSTHSKSALHAASANRKVAWRIAR